MAHASRRPARLQRLSLLLFALAVALMAGEWVLLVAGTHLHEMLVGAASVLAATTFLYFVYRSEALQTKFRAKDIFACWRIPWYLASGIYEITAILLKDLLHIKRAGSFYRVAGFKTSKRDPLLIARRVLAIIYTTVAPNFIVIGIDYDQSRMLFHQLERSSIPKMTQELGAQP
jgi:hypothetical protein